MTATRPAARDLRKRILGREHVLGTFLKTPGTHPVEILGLLGFDFVIVDQEHSPFDRASTDLACFAARATNIGAIVRVPEAHAASILAVLDSGASGVMVPHCSSPETVRLVASACRYRTGSRGFANTTRAGGFGNASYDDHIAEQDANVVCIAMIEDAAALDCLPEIMAVQGIDAFFIGRGDLTAALGVEKMKAAVVRITEAARAANVLTMALVSSREDARSMRELGVTAFVHSNDHSLLKSAAAQALRDYGDPAAW